MEKVFPSFCILITLLQSENNDSRAPAKTRPDISLHEESKGDRHEQRLQGKNIGKSDQALGQRLQTLQTQNFGLECILDSD